MQGDDDFQPGRKSNWSLEAAGSSLLRVTLLFGSIAVALAMLIAPLADHITRRAMDEASIGLDTMTTSSIRKGERYTIRRSVLQPSPDSVCIIRQSGARSGNC